MHRNSELYSFLLERTHLLTEQWYDSVDKTNPSGVYSSQDPEVIKSLKKKNYEFHLRFCKMFDESSSDAEFLSSFNEWIYSASRDEEHKHTPIYLILKEFFNNQEQYLNFVQAFVEMSNEAYSLATINRWNRKIVENFSYVITAFTKQSHKYAEKCLATQKQLIHELSSPLISLNEKLALLPLVAEIDEDRAKLIIENTLQQCVNLRVTHILVDLSGVLTVNEMVAHQLFQLIQSLKLIGVKSTLSGIRPEIAQTSVRIGIEFNDLSVVPSIHKALASYKI